MNWLHTQMAALDIARAIVSFAANWLLQSTLLIALGLAIARLMRHRGSALQSAIYRTTLAAVIVCPLASGLLALASVSGWSPPMPQAWTYDVGSTPDIAEAEPTADNAAAQTSQPSIEESTLAQQSPPNGDASRTAVGAASESLPPTLADGRVGSLAANASAPNSLSSS